MNVLAAVRHGRVSLAEQSQTLGQTDLPVSKAFANRDHHLGSQVGITSDQRRGGRRLGGFTLGAAAHHRRYPMGKSCARPNHHHVAPLHAANRTPDAELKEESPVSFETRLP